LGRFPSASYWGVASNGAGLFVSPRSTSSDVATSPDGITWTVRALPSVAQWANPAWNGTVFCVTEWSSAGGKAATSTDGITWTARTLSVTSDRNVTIGANSTLISTQRSAAGTIASVSTDNGATWANSTLPSSALWATGTYGPCFFLMAGNVSPSTAGALSIDGVTWFATTVTASGLFVSGDTTSAASNGTNFVLVGQLSGGGNTRIVNIGSGYTTAPSVTSTNLSPATAGLQFSAQDNGSNANTQYLMIKNAAQAWSLTNASGATPSLISDVDYPGTYSVTLTSLTRSGTVATATTPSNTNFQVGSTVTIAGATPSAYNGAQVITAVTPESEISIGPIEITSITRSGTTATVITKGNHGFANGSSITISGATESAWNGAYAIAWVSATSFTYTVTVVGTNSSTTTYTALSSPATGTITATCPNFPLISVVLTDAGATGSVSGFIQVGTSAPFVSGQVINISNISVPISQQASATGSKTLTAVGTDSLGRQTFTYTTAAGVYLNNIATAKITLPTVTSVTSAGNVATITFAGAHNMENGFFISVYGASPSNYTTSSVIRVISSTVVTYAVELTASTATQISTPISPAAGSLSALYNLVTGASFTFTITGSPATPATGTITATGGRNTVRGIVYLDGYFCVMDIYGVIYNSAQDDPRTWNALEFTTADSESGAGKCLVKSQNFAMALKEWSTEAFYRNPDNVIGSVLSKVSNGFTQVGCADGDSVALLEGSIIWMAQTRAEGRSIYIMQGTQQQKISTDDVDRILKRDDLANVRSYGLAINGHSLYILSLYTSNITLVYDMTSKVWGQWSSLTIGAQSSVSSITLVGTTATVTDTAHGLSDGDPVKISGANQSGYNGIWPITYVSANVFTIEVAAGLTTPATGTILAFPYTESYDKFSHFANALGRYMTLHTSDGRLYEMLSTLYQDAGIPISTLVRTVRLDGGSLEEKQMSKASLVADSVADVAIIRWSDDDCTTYCAYRPLNLIEDRPNVRRSKSFRRRTIEVKHIGNNPFHAKNLEIEV